VLTVRRGAVIAPGGVDQVIVADGESELVFVYSIENHGDGVLDLGAFHVYAVDAAAAWIEHQPAALVPPGESTTLELRINLAGSSGEVAVQGWSSDPGAAPMQWRVEIETVDAGCTADCTPTPTATASPTASSAPTSTPSPTANATASPTATATQTPACGDGSGDPEQACEPPLRIVRMRLNLGASRHVDRGHIRLVAEMDEDASGEELLLGLAAGLTIRVADADESFAATTAFTDCLLRRSGRTVVCGGIRDGARVIFRQRQGGVWRIQFNAVRLLAAQTGAADPESNPLDAPATVEIERSGRMNSGNATNCRPVFPRRLTCSA